MGFLSGKGIKKLDFYPKIAEEHRVRTISGAVLSLLTLFFVIILFYQETSHYLKTGVSPELKVDRSFQEFIQINIDIYFPELACDTLNIDVVDATGSQLHVTDNIDKKRISKNGNLIERDAPPAVSVENSAKNECGSCYGAERDEDHCCETCEDVKDAYKKKGWVLKDPSIVPQCNGENYSLKKTQNSLEGCRFSGHIGVKKVRGSFYFSLAPSKHETNWHHNQDSYNMSHTINKFSFGAEFPGHFNPLDGVTKVSGDDYSSAFTYFAIVVPTTYSSLYGKPIKSSQYSVTEHSRPIPRPTRQQQQRQHFIPGVFFQYDLSPIKVTFTEEHLETGQFLTNLCTIIGGLFTVAGVVDTLLYKGLTAKRQAAD